MNKSCSPSAIRVTGSVPWFVCPACLSYTRLPVQNPLVLERCAACALRFCRCCSPWAGWLLWEPAPPAAAGCVFSPQEVSP